MRSWTALPLVHPIRSTRLALLFRTPPPPRSINPSPTTFPATHSIIIMHCCLYYDIGILIIRSTLQGHFYKPTLIELSIFCTCVYMYRIGESVYVGLHAGHTLYNIQKLVRVIDIGKCSIKARTDAPHRCVQTYNYVFNLLQQCAGNRRVFIIIYNMKQISSLSVIFRNLKTL